MSLPAISLALAGRRRALRDRSSSAYAGYRQLIEAEPKRPDPAQNGQGGSIGDIGPHAFHLFEYISGLQVTAINAALRFVVSGRRLDDDCSALVRLNNGAAGTLACSQAAAGELNEMRVRIYWGNRFDRTVSFIR